MRELADDPVFQEWRAVEVPKLLGNPLRRAATIPGLFIAGRDRLIVGIVQEAPGAPSWRFLISVDHQRAGIGKGYPDPQSAAAAAEQHLLGKHDIEFLKRELGDG